VAISNASFGQVIRGHFQCDSIACQNADSIAAQPAREVGEDGTVLIEQDAELAAREFFNYSAGDFDAVFFAHSPPKGDYTY